MHAGLRSALFGSALPLAGFEFAADFRNSWHRSGPVVSRDVRALPTCQFARNGQKGEDVGGVLTIVPTNEPLIAPNVGYFARPPRTNLLGNSTFAGAAVGTFPSVFQFVGIGAGRTMAIVGVGNDDGVPYIDVRCTFDGTQTQRVYLEIVGSGTSGYIAGAQPDSFWASVYVQRLAGTWPSGSNLQSREFTAAPSYLDNTNTTLLDVGATKVRKITGGPLKNANTAKATWEIQISADAGEARDITFRLSAPSFNKNTFDGQYVPTSAGAVTSGEDRLMFNPPAPIVSGEDHIVIVKANVLVPASATEQCLFAAFYSGDTSSYIQLNRYNGGGVSFTSWITGNVQSNIAIANAMPGTGVVTVAYIRRGGINTLAVRVGTGAVQFLARTAVEAWPPNLDRMMIGGRVGTVATRFADSAFEFVGVRRGTFTDDQVRTILTTV